MKQFITMFLSLTLMLASCTKENTGDNSCPKVASIERQYLCPGCGDAGYFVTLVYDNGEKIYRFYSLNEIENKNMKSGKRACNS